MRRFFNICLKETFCPVGLITCRAMQQLQSYDDLKKADDITQYHPDR